MRHPLLVLALALVPSLAQAQEQLVVVDVRYVHSATTTVDSHYHLDPIAGTPTDLTAPVDYAAGDAVVRLEVFTKPSDAGTRFQVCFEGMPTYACTDQAPAYTTTGVYTWTTPFSRFYQGSMIDWTQGTGRIALILKDTMNNKPSPENVGATESARYMPTEVRVTVTFVPPGATYSPPADTIDAGVVPHDAAVVPMTDAATSPDAARTPIDAGHDAAATAPSSSGGCSVATGARSHAMLVLSLAALVLSRRRISRAPIHLRAS
jgi:hypothetical protein